MKPLRRFKYRYRQIGPITLFSIGILAAPLTVVAQETQAGKEKDNPLPEIKDHTGRVRPGTLEDVARTGSKTDTPLRDIPRPSTWCLRAC